MILRSQIVDQNHMPINPAALEGHVYLVDDNEDIRHHLTLLLKRYGLTVDAFNSAEMLLKLSAINEHAVILLDMSLPGVSGVKAFEALRNKGCKTPVVFISGQSEPVEIIDAMKLGATDFLWKPFTTNDLLAAIKKALATARIQGELSSIYQSKLNLWNAMTVREKEICTLMMNGCGNTEIGERLNVQPDTIKKHRARIMEKFGTSTLSQLVDIFRGFNPAD